MINFVLTVTGSEALAERGNLLASGRQIALNKECPRRSARSSPPHKELLHQGLYFHLLI